MARLAAPVRRLAAATTPCAAGCCRGRTACELHPQDAQDSHLIAHAAAADAIALIAHGEGEAAAGELVEYRAALTPTFSPRWPGAGCPGPSR